MSNAKSSSGIGFPGLLAIVFITLKLCHVIDWSWWWVLSPLWITFGIVAGLIIIVGVLKVMADKTETALRRAETPAQRSARLCGEIANRMRSGKS